MFIRYADLSESRWRYRMISWHELTLLTYDIAYHSFDISSLMDPVNILRYMFSQFEYVSRILDVYNSARMRGSIVRNDEQFCPYSVLYWRSHFHHFSFWYGLFSPAGGVVGGRQGLIRLRPRKAAHEEPPWGRRAPLMAQKGVTKREVCIKMYLVAIKPPRASTNK